MPSRIHCSSSIILSICMSEYMQHNDGGLFSPNFHDFRKWEIREGAKYKERGLRRKGKYMKAMHEGNKTEGFTLSPYSSVTL